MALLLLSGPGLQRVILLNPVNSSFPSSYSVPLGHGPRVSPDAALTDVKPGFPWLHIDALDNSLVFQRSLHVTKKGSRCYLG